MSAIMSLLFGILSVANTSGHPNVVFFEPTFIISPSCNTLQHDPCETCTAYVDDFKNEVAFWTHLTQDIQFVCGRVFGNTTDQCVNVTQDLKERFDWLTNYSSIQMCHYLDYCS